MKKHLYSLAFLAMMISSCGPTYIVQSRPVPPPPPPPAEAPAPEPETEPEVSYQTFYDDLSPYGQWIDYPGYGYVWRPDTGPDFKPYSTNGHWVYSDAGWTWASDYNWGWAAFHYGRWFFEDGYGWMWIPGYEWSPAWVSWRRSPDYYGWAPLGPNISVSVSFGGGYNPPPHYWCFVPHQYINNPHVNNYYVNETKNVTIINNTTIINNNVTNNRINNTNINNNNRFNRNTYAGGPDPREVETATGANLRPIPLRTGNRPGEQVNNGQMTIFRPRVNAAPQSQPGANGGNNSGFPSRPAATPAPTRVQPFRELRPSPNFSRNQAGGNPAGNGAVPAVNNPPAANNVSPAPSLNNGPARNNGGNNPNGNDRNNGNDRGNRPGNNNQPAGNNQPSNNNNQPAQPAINNQPSSVNNRPAVPAVNSSVPGNFNNNNNNDNRFRNQPLPAPPSQQNRQAQAMPQYRPNRTAPVTPAQPPARQFQPAQQSAPQNRGLQPGQPSSQPAPRVTNNVSRPSYARPPVPNPPKRDDNKDKQKDK